MTTILFAQPFTVNAKFAANCVGRTVVLDLAFNGGNPQGKGTPAEQFAATTVAFINALGDNLVAWVDHHQFNGENPFAGDARFHTFNREQAPACPPVITPELVALIGDADTLVLHGDFDGVASGVKFKLGGKDAYEGMTSDAVAADTREGELSQTGKWLEDAMKADLKDDSVREAVFVYLTTGDKESKAKIEAAAVKYEAVGLKTEEFVKGFKAPVTYVDASDVDANTFNLTNLLVAGQKVAKVAVVRNSQNGNVQITVAGPQGYDFVTLFGLGGGMPNRVNLPDQDVNEVLAKIISIIK